MTPLNGNIFRVTGPLWGESIGNRRNSQWRGALVFSLICAWTNGWATRQDDGDLRRHRAQYYVTVMFQVYFMRTALYLLPYTMQGDNPTEYRHIELWHRMI